MVSLKSWKMKSAAVGLKESVHKRLCNWPSLSLRTPNLQGFLMFTGKEIAFGCFA